MIPAKALMTQPTASVRRQLEAWQSRSATRPEPRTRLLNLQMVALGVYLWVIHSQKLALAQPAILVGLAGILIQHDAIRLPRTLIWFGGFVLWAFVSAAASQYPDVALEAAWNYLKIWMIFLVAVNVAHSSRQLRGFMILWLGLYALYPVRGTLFNLAAGISTGNRYAWNFVFSNPNDLATLTLPMLALVIVLLPGERGWTRTAAWAGAVILPGIIVATQSRAGILALAGMGGLFVVNARRARQTTVTQITKRSSHRGTYALVALAATVVIGLVAPQGVWDRLRGLGQATSTENLEAVDAEGSAAQRFAIWKVSWAMAADHPLLGVGPGLYPRMNAEYARRGNADATARGQRDTHSTYFNALAEGGVPAFLLFLGMLWSAFSELRRRGRTAPGESADRGRSRYVLGVGLAGFLFASVFATMQHLPFLYLYLAVLATTVALEPAAPGQIPPATALARSPSRRVR